MPNSPEQNLQNLLKNFPPFRELSQERCEQIYKIVIEKEMPLLKDYILLGIIQAYITAITSIVIDIQERNDSPCKENINPIL